MKKFQSGDGATQPGRLPRAGVAFNFSQLATVPAYQVMIAAISDAGNATIDLLSDAQWVELLAVAGEAARYGDRCGGCGRSLVFPFRAEPTDNGVAMTYLCGCGNTWFTSYSDDW